MVTNHRKQTVIDHACGPECYAERTPEELERDLAESNAGALRVTAAEARFILAGREYVKADEAYRVAFEAACLAKVAYLAFDAPGFPKAECSASTVALALMIDAARAMVKP